MNENIKSTKFIITVLCLVVVSVGFFIGKITSEIFMPFILGILGIYGITNTASKIIKPDSAN